MLNAETLAQLALLARYGGDWFRRLGTPEDPGTFLATVTGSDSRTVARPGVLEAARATPLSALLAAAGTDLSRVGAVLVGGYHGAWVPGSDRDVLLTSARPVAVRRHPGRRAWSTCWTGRPARSRSPPTVTSYLAGQGRAPVRPVRQRAAPAGPDAAAAGGPGAPRALVAEVERLRRLVDGRGACAHPDGTARFVASTMRVFADHVQDHLRGDCHARAR